MRILLFEKDEGERQKLIQLFRQVELKADLTTDVAESEEQIMQLLQQAHYDCVYIGVDLFSMPDSEKLLMQIQELGKQTPIVVLLAHENEKNIYQSIISGVSGYLSKQQLTTPSILTSLKQALNSVGNKDHYEVSHLKQVFLSDMGHELRTPMSAILGFSGLLMQSNLDESQYKFAQSIYEATNNLLTIINDVLDYSKIESGKLTIEQADFNVRQLLHKIKKRLENQGVHQHKPYLTLYIDEKLPDFLKSDDKRLEQILWNLINEATKFIVGSSIDLFARMIAYKEGQVNVQFEVKCAGASISQDQVKTIFDSLNYLGTNHFQRFGDIGLGLVIVKKLVSFLGGNIVVQHNKSGEVSFICDFRMEVGQAIQEQSNGLEDGVALDNVRVLVCEDNILSQELTKEILHRLGCKVDIADNGKVGVEKLQNKAAQYDVVLMDIQMPKMNGIEATYAIRELDSVVKDIPVIALTAQNVTDEKDKYFEAGMTDYLTKPFTPADITRKVLKYLPKKAIKNKPTSAAQTTGQTTSHTLFDLNFLRDAFGDNPVIFQELLQLLTNQFLKFKQDVSNGLFMKNWKVIANAAQIIKTNLRAFGLKSLENKVILIEEYASKQESVGLIPDLIRDCEDIFAGAIKELNSLLEDENTTQGKHLYRNS
ncbi:response regulator [uncultured Microscilla sp.]|uniref:response regulator n=1 Tax=uncultured Microscilla sp. TaxID=432653 RepID=UPI002601D595|nr:response regulator [uncultured Microscilla sp.]